MTPFTVIIPAHNEASVIARCLAAITASSPPSHQTQIIVVANGCHDDTVAIARKAAPQALVLDLLEGSKTAAMNRAGRDARYFPRIYLDADVQCSFQTLHTLAEVLNEPGVMAASPKLKMDFSRSNWLVKAYYRVWLTQPYVTQGMIGSGCFGISKAGFEVLGDFPPITGDDVWVHSRFALKERRNISQDKNGNPVSFLVSPPRRAIDQIRVETRRRLGNAEVHRRYPSPHSSGSNAPGDLAIALKNGASILDVAVYLAIKAIVRFRASRIMKTQGGIVWERDLKAREVGPE